MRRGCRQDIVIVHEGGAWVCGNAGVRVRVGEEERKEEDTLRRQGTGDGKGCACMAVRVVVN